MSNFVNISKEIRYWIITIIVFVIFCGLGYVYFSSKIEQKDKEIDELSRKLKSKPKVEIRYKTQVKYKDRVKWKTKKEEIEHVYYVEPSEETQELFDRYCENCRKENITPEISIDDLRFRCTADICNPENASCYVKDGYTIVETALSSKVKGFFKLSGIAGYDIIGQRGLLGISFFDYKGIVIGADVLSNFEYDNKSGIGLFGGYRPQTKKWRLNLVFGAGPVSHFDDFGRIGLQVFIGVNILDRD